MNKDELLLRLARDVRMITKNIIGVNESLEEMERKRQISTMGKCSIIMELGKNSDHLVDMMNALSELDALLK